jgi:putative flippase GtrA
MSAPSTRASAAAYLEKLYRHATWHEIRQVVRYFAAGILVSLGYTVTVVYLVEYLHWGSPSLANAVSFALWTPVSYLAHRFFTFRFDGSYESSALRFVVTFLGKLGASLAVMALVEFLGLYYVYGVIANWIAIPLGAYLTLRLWVFEAGSAPETRDQTPRCVEREDAVSARNAAC